MKHDNIHFSVLCDYEFALFNTFLKLKKKLATQYVEKNAYRNYTSSN